MTNFLERSVLIGKKEGAFGWTGFVPRRNLNVGLVQLNTLDIRLTYQNQDLIRSIPQM